MNECLNIGMFSSNLPYYSCLKTFKLTLKEIDQNFIFMMKIIVVICIKSIWLFILKNKTTSVYFLKKSETIFSLIEIGKNVSLKIYLKTFFEFEKDLIFLSIVLLWYNFIDIFFSFILQKIFMTIIFAGFYHIGEINKISLSNKNDIINPFWKVFSFFIFCMILLLVLVYFQFLFKMKLPYRQGKDWIIPSSTNVKAEFYFLSLILLYTFTLHKFNKKKVPKITTIGKY